MALKSILQVPSLADRLTSVRIERFDPVGANFQNCVTSGLIPLLAYVPNLTNTEISAGKAIVGGTLVDVASVTPTFTASVWNYVWVDDAGVLQTGTEWPGSGNFAPDAQGIGTSVVELRAERIGGGNGRVYHVNFTATDASGASCSGTVLVSVPVNQGPNGAAVDDGPLHDAALPE